MKPFTQTAVASAICLAVVLLWLVTWLVAGSLRLACGLVFGMETRS